MSGVVEEVNEALADQPGLINKSPEERGEWSAALLSGCHLTVLKGWLCKIKLSDPSEVCLHPSNKHETNGGIGPGIVNGGGLQVEARVDVQEACWGFNILAYASQIDYTMPFQSRIHNNLRNEGDDGF